MWRASGAGHACARACETIAVGTLRFSTWHKWAGDFPCLFTGMEILIKEGRIPSELVPLAIAWGQGVAAEIEALLYPPKREEPPEGGPAQM